MSTKETLYTVVQAQFQEAFGQPDNKLGGGKQWTLRPLSQPHSCIHVLLNGTPKDPGVWVFDPHDAKTGVENTPVVDKRQIGDLIHLIQQRLDFAARPPFPQTGF